MNRLFFQAKQILSLPVYKLRMLPHRLRVLIIFIEIVSVFSFSLLIVSYAAPFANTHEGTLLSYHGDDLAHKKAHNIYFLKTTESEETYLDIPNNEKLPFKYGDRVKVKGQKSGKEIKVFTKNNRAEIKKISDSQPQTPGQSVSGNAGSGSNALASSHAKVLPASTNPTRKTLVIMFNFKNDRSRPLSVDQVRGRIFTQPDSANGNYAHMSYGKAPKLVGVERVDGDIANWVTIDRDNTNCKVNYLTWTFLARQEVMKKNKRFAGNEYEQLIYIFPPSTKPADACPWGGLTVTEYVIGNPYDEIWLPLNNGVTPPPALEHELGHLYGLDHSASIDCRNGDNTRIISKPDPVNSCTLNEYGDFSDIMGGDSSGKHTSSYHKEKLQWISPANLQTVNTSGIYTIGAIDLKPNGVQAFRLPIGDGKFYYMDYTVDTDAQTGTYSPAVRMRLVYPERGNLKYGIDSALMWLQPNDRNLNSQYTLQKWDGPITDPITKATIQVKSFDSGKAEIEITFPQTPPPTSNLISASVDCKYGKEAVSISTPQNSADKYIEVDNDEDWGNGYWRRGPFVNGVSHLTSSTINTLPNGFIAVGNVSAEFTWELNKSYRIRYQTIADNAYSSTLSFTLTPVDCTPDNSENKAMALPLKPLGENPFTDCDKNQDPLYGTKHRTLRVGDTDDGNSSNPLDDHHNCVSHLHWYLLESYGMTQTPKYNLSDTYAGVFDELTKKAAAEFQGIFGIAPVSGTVGPLTWHQLHGGTRLNPVEISQNSQLLPDQQKLFRNQTYTLGTKVIGHCDTDGKVRFVLRSKTEPVERVLTDISGLTEFSITGDGLVTMNTHIGSDFNINSYDLIARYKGTKSENSCPSI